MSDLIDATKYLKYSDELTDYLLSDNITEIEIYGDDGKTVHYVRVLKEPKKSKRIDEHYPNCGVDMRGDSNG